MLPASYGLLDYPGSSQSMVTAINNTGTVAGIYVDAGGTSHGFTYSGGTFTTVDQPGTVFNQALGINDFNTTVGYSSATDPSGATGETAYSQHGGTFTNINALLPSNQNSQAVGINNAGNIVGFYVSGSDNIGFLDVGGSISTIDPFGSTTAQALGINSPAKSSASTSTAAAPHTVLPTLADTSRASTPRRHGHGDQRHQRSRATGGLLP